MIQFNCKSSANFSETFYSDLAFPNPNKIVKFIGNCLFLLVISRVFNGAIGERVFVNGLPTKNSEYNNSLKAREVAVERTRMFLQNDPKQRYIEIDSFLSDRECTHALEFLSEKQEHARASETRSEKNSQVTVSKNRISKELSLLPSLGETSWPTEEIAQIIEKICSFLAKEFNIELLTVLDRVEQISIISYEQGKGHFALHYDDIPKPGDGKRRREASMLIYLNDVDVGGETVFPDYKIAVKPKQGRAVLFGNHGMKGPLHAGNIPVSGPKHVIAIFFMEKPDADSSMNIRASGHRNSLFHLPLRLPDLPSESEKKKANRIWPDIHSIYEDKTKDILDYFDHHFKNRNQSEFKKGLEEIILISLQNFEDNHLFASIFDQYFKEDELFFSEILEQWVEEKKVGCVYLAPFPKKARSQKVRAWLEVDGDARLTPNWNSCTREEKEWVLTFSSGENQEIFKSHHSDF
jgi:prolyl 4-hydroxylase